MTVFHQQFVVTYAVSADAVCDFAVCNDVTVTFDGASTTATTDYNQFSTITVEADAMFACTATASYSWRLYR